MDFGERPNKATFDREADVKIRYNADPPFKPYELTKEGYNDCFMLFAHYLCVNWSLRGAMEVSVIKNRNRFAFFIFFILTFFISSLAILVAIILFCRRKKQVSMKGGSV